MRRRSLIFGTSILLLALGAACGEDEPTEPAASPEPTESPQATPEPTESPTDGGGRDGYASPDEGPDATSSPTGDRSRETEIEAEDSALGTILTDSEGNTLYLFLNDADGESTCYDECEANWPPLLARGEVKVDDELDASLLGTTERRDGKAQVTYAGMPLYYFAGDQRPGDTNGQGIGDVWHVVAPDGTPIQG